MAHRLRRSDPYPYSAGSLVNEAARIENAFTQVPYRGDGMGTLRFFGLGLQRSRFERGVSA